MIDYYEKLIKNRDTTYKLYLLKYIFSSAKKGKKNFSFKELACGILSEAWEDLCNKASRFLEHDRLFDLFLYVLRLNDGIDNYTDKKDVFEYLICSKDKFIVRKLKELVAYVPYRLIVIDEISYVLKGKKDSEKNKIIESYSKVNDNMMYVIESKNITLREKFYNDITNNYYLLYNWICNMIKIVIGDHL